MRLKRGDSAVSKSHLKDATCDCEEVAVVTSANRPISWNRGQQSHGLWAKPAIKVVYMKLDCRAAVGCYIFICGCVCLMLAEPDTCDRECVASKAPNLH